MSFKPLTDESIVAPELLAYKGKECSLTKIASTRENWSVTPGMIEYGEVEFKDIPPYSEGPNATTGGYGVYVGRGFHYIRTSPVVKVVDVTETSVTFTTEGGVYLLEAGTKR
jgi:hypothetical protein